MPPQAVLKRAGRGGDPGVRTAGRRGETYLAVAAVTLFLLVRLALLVAREPFFDELFTVWMAHKPLAQILPPAADDERV